MFKITCFLWSLIFCFSCGVKSENTQEASLPKQEDKLIRDTLTVDFVDLKAKNLLSKTKIVTVQNDPVYHKTKNYNAILLIDLLKKYSSIENLEIEDTKVIFECEDGYKPEMPLKLLVSVKAYLAINDADATNGLEWEKIMKDGHEMKAAPFYIVYEGVSPSDGTYKWPYNLVKLHFAPINENVAALKPKDKNLLAGYNLYISKCQTCHAINKIGGEMGPELNYPKSVTEYWKKDHLVAFLQNPAAYRNGIKMPKLDVSEQNANDIFDYLTYMSKNKIK